KSIAMIPFVEDLSSGIGEQPIYLSLSMIGVDDDTSEHWLNLILGLVELRQISNGERVSCDVRFERSFVSGIATVSVIEIVPDRSLSDSEWYEVLIPELPKDILEANRSNERYLTGTASWRSRFRFGHDLRISSIEIASNSLSIKMSESMTSYDDVPGVEVLQGEGESLCESVVPDEHWRTVGSYRIDCRCKAIDPMSPISINLSGTGYSGSTGESSKSLAELSVNILPDELISRDSIWLYIP
ncbi:MAG TPA: hypothetical protein PLY68_08400, partial [Myxococcota bacterium]|nr:hypothetical protein [Myxococcota bacterium]HPB50798.1 hypothetical protein [Myxococcota bacterium]HQP96195.1 hypothetical protein [Myxococcota bacterium]